MAKRLVLCLMAIVLAAACVVQAADSMPSQEPRKVSALVADWFKGSHPDVIISRIFKTYSLDGKGEQSLLKLVSVFRDKPSDRDVSAQYAKDYDFKISGSVEDALTLGTGKLAVDGVIICTEWCDYPVSPTGQTMYPHKRLFEDTVKVFKASNRVVPVFIDKHIADNWPDIKWIYDTAKAMKIPLMAGSSVPVSWRRPQTDVQQKSKLKEIVGISYHTLDGYGFHGMEMVQCLAEQRKGGETGIKSVQCLTDNAVWEAAGKVYDKELFDAAIERQGRKIPEGQTVKDLVEHPVLFVMDYYDGLRVNLFTLNGFSGRWTSAWRYADGSKDATLFLLDEGPGLKSMHFANQMKGIEKIILTGKPSWPAERTLLTSGALDALLVSKKEGGKPVKTPYLRISYAPFWHWQEPAELQRE